MDEFNLKVFNMIKGINESETFLAKYILIECRCEFEGRKCNLRQKWNNDNSQCECKKLIKYFACKECYVWNPSTYICKCDKGCKIGKWMHE